MRTIEEWTQYFMSQGFDLLEAREKADARIAFEQEVDTIDLTTIPRSTL